MVHVGDTVDASAPAPVVVNFHGLNNSPGIQQFFSQMDRLADREGFVVVYPQGIGASFNAGTCCGPANEQGIDDLAFTRTVVADVSTRGCVDRRRIYATGFSNGGYMSHRVGCEAADLFAAIAPVAAANASPGCAPDRAVPVIAFHGTADTVVAYDAGAEATSHWATRNGCAASPIRTELGRSYCDQWIDCDGGATVELCTLTGWNHLWPGALTAIPASERLWAFFERFQLP